METPQNWVRNIVLFLASQTVSLFGSMLVQYAIMWHITLTTQSGVMMTIAIVCGFLPTFFLSPFAGVWADRYDRKLIIVLADAGIAASTLALAVLFSMGYDSVWLLFLLSAIRALGSGVYMPAVGAFIPQLVPADRLMRVNGLNGSIQSMVTLVSPMVAGALLTMATIETIFYIDVVTAAAAISILLLFLHVPVHAKAMSKQAIGYFQDMRDGFAYIGRNDFVRTFFLFNAAFFVLIAPLAFLTPLQVARSFGDDVWRLSAIEVAFAVGMMIGGGVMASWGGFTNRVRTMALANGVTGACTIVLGLPPAFWFYLFVLGLIGLALPVFEAPATVLLQQRVDGDFLGRVLGVNTMIATSTMPAAMLVFGPAADLIPIEWLLLGTGSLLVVHSLLMLTNRAMLEAGKPFVKGIP